MKCPVCGREMQEGEMIADGVSVDWVPMDSLSVKGWLG